MSFHRQKAFIPVIIIIINEVVRFLLLTYKISWIPSTDTVLWQPQFLSTIFSFFYSLYISCCGVHFMRCLTHITTSRIPWNLPMVPSRKKIHSKMCNMDEASQANIDCVWNMYIFSSTIIMQMNILTFINFVTRMSCCFTCALHIFPNLKPVGFLPFFIKSPSDSTHVCKSMMKSLFSVSGPFFHFIFSSFIA